MFFLQIFVKGSSFSTIFVLWFTLGLLEAASSVPNVTAIGLGNSCNELWGSSTHIACPSNTLSLQSPGQILGGKLLCPEHYAFFQGDRNSSILSEAAFSVAPSRSHLPTPLFREWPVIHSCKRRCQARTSPPGENLVHSGMTTIKEKTTATSRHLSTNKAGMKSERNPTFLLAWLSKKGTQNESTSYKERSKWSFPIIIRTQSLWYLWELNLNKAPSSRLLHIMNKNMKLVLCQKNNP